MRPCPWHRSIQHVREYHDSFPGERQGEMGRMVNRSSWGICISARNSGEMTEFQYCSRGTVVYLRTNAAFARAR